MQPGVDLLVPVDRIVRLQHPVILVGEIQEAALDTAALRRRKRGNALGHRHPVVPLAVEYQHGCVEAPGLPGRAPAVDALEAVLKDEIIRMYEEVAEHPEGEFHFFHGRDAAERFGYAPEWLDDAPAGAVASFAGVGNPHARSNLQPGETVLDLGSGAGLDAIVASRFVGSTGRVIGVDLNPSMCIKAQAHAAATGTTMECHEGRMEEIPLPDETADVVISNGVINLSFRKRKVVEEMYRVLKPGGRLVATLAVYLVAP